jgi:uncharacterized protein
VSEQLPSREQAEQILKQNHCPPQVLNHCLAVTDLAVEIASDLQRKGQKIDLRLVEAGGMLHDLGRTKSHSVDHGVVGGEIAQALGLPESVVKIIKRHVGAGITAEEAKWLGWPNDVYVPESLEEKVVCYADKLIDHDQRVPIEMEIKRLEEQNFPQAAERVRRLHTEIQGLLVEEK